MNEKYLPIKIFEKRKEYDDRKTEAGGSPDRDYSWVLHGEPLKQHMQLLTQSLSTMKERCAERKSEGKVLPVVMKTTLHAEALAKTHRKKLVDVLESDGHENVIGVYGDRQILSLVENNAILDKITDVINKEDNASVISAITDMELYEPFIERTESGCGEYRVRLLNYNDYDRNQLVKILFEQHCRQHNIKLNTATRFTSDMYIYRVTIDSADEMNFLEDFEGLYAAEETKPLALTLDALEFDEASMVRVPDPEENYPLAGVLDTGIAGISYLKPWKEAKEHTNYPVEYQNNAHGTFVAGIMEYGDELNSYKVYSTKGIRLFNAVVYPDERKEAIYPEDLVDNIREAVKRNPQVKVWNLSLGTKEECELDEFSEFGMALDNIQDENNVLIVKSAGNCANFMKGLPKSRISKSGDSVRALVVGSVAGEKELYDYAEPNTPSPFTRIGPGPANIIKPDLVFYGGNAGVDDLGNLVKHGVRSFGLNERVVRDSGTSFSTPVVTRIASELAFMMNEDFDPLMIRALMIHYAKYPSNNSMKMEDKTTQMGFGIPVSAQDILYNSPDKITLILRDTLEKRSFIEMFDFPYPTSLIDENGYCTGQIILTLVSKTIVDDKQAGEYCQSNMDVYFGTYETEVDRDTTRPTIRNPKGLGDNRNLLSDGLYSSRVKGVHPLTGFERECTLVKYGKKFHPVKKYAVDLAEMTPANKEKYLPSGRKWYLKLEGLYRDFLEKDAERRGTRLSQEFCMLLTIRDPKHQAPVYDEVVQQLTNRNFIHHDVKVRNEVQVDNTL